MEFDVFNGIIRSKNPFSNLKKIPYTEFYDNNHYSFLNKYLVCDGFIAGGCFKDIIYGKKPRDIDVYFHNKEDYENAYKLYKRGYLLIYNNDNAACFYDRDNCINIELIHRNFGTPTEIIDSFDFTVCQMAYFISDYDIDLNNNETPIYKLLHNNRFDRDLCQKRLCLVGDNITNPLGTFKRVIKYTKYGFYPSDNILYLIAQGIHGLESINEEDFNIYPEE